ncbi:hypothetical protein HK097_000112 [Rhizophlyctis rosea]|uniref:Aminoglycoside phosphotransferase domain-containing protein n=1 Tax=Rhizophlyctis rosea TaxID=64517 RepID=A0AAD5S8E4_9FUNG|nr:hypothetical protein HK097_000112 [Rhizophlyctis rosea]
MTSTNDLDPRDAWPKDFDGKGLYNAVVAGHGTGFRINIHQMISWIEMELSCKVVDIPMGFQLKLSDARMILMRVGRYNSLHPHAKETFLHSTIREVQFEAAVHDLLMSDPNIPVSPLLLYRLPVGKVMGIDVDPERLDEGRQVMVFELTDGRPNVWDELDPMAKKTLITQLATVRVALFQRHLPIDFVSQWLHSRWPIPHLCPNPPSPTRAFTLALLTAKIESMIGKEGDPIGVDWKESEFVVGPKASAAKQSLLRIIPLILPHEDEKYAFYRFVLEHSDFGVHNMSIALTSGQPHITSVFDWETGHIVPAILSDPESVLLPVDLNIDSDGEAMISRIYEDADDEELAEITEWGDVYLNTISDVAPEYITAIRSGKDSRYLWTKLKGWRGDDPEGFFGELGFWAEQRMMELSLV